MSRNIEKKRRTLGVGDSVGREVGDIVMGAGFVGERVGRKVGEPVGRRVGGHSTVGEPVGRRVGERVGGRVARVGLRVGSLAHFGTGARVGRGLGAMVGRLGGVVGRGRGRRDFTGDAVLT